MQTMTETLQKLIGKPLVESTDQEIYLPCWILCAARAPHRYARSTAASCIISRLNF